MPCATNTEAVSPVSRNSMVHNCRRTFRERVDLDATLHDIHRLCRSCNYLEQRIGAQELCLQLCKRFIAVPRPGDQTSQPTGEVRIVCCFALETFVICSVAEEMDRMRIRLQFCDEMCEDANALHRVWHISPVKLLQVCSRTV